MIDNRKSWDVDNEAVVDELKDLIGLTSEEQALLGNLHGQAQEAAPQVVDAFYERLLGHEHTSEYLQHVSVDHLRSMVNQWFTDLFGGRYDEEYTRKRLKIGQVHVRIGLPVRYPLAMLDMITKAGEEVARSSAEPDRATVAFRKILALDIAVFNHSYESFPLQQLADMVGNMRLARRLLSGARSTIPSAAS
jgi:hypothetical protein